MCVRVCVCENAYVFVVCHQCVLGSIVKQQVSEELPVDWEKKTYTKDEVSGTVSGSRRSSSSSSFLFPERKRNPTS